MDPDACLSEIRSIVQHVDDPDEPDAVEDRFERLVELVDGLDTWMRLGGYPPGAWGQHLWRHLREAPAYSNEGTRVDRGKLDEYVGRSLMLVTALSPDIGYDRASAIGV